MGQDRTAAAVAMSDGGRSWAEIADRLHITVAEAKALVEPVRAQRRADLAKTSTPARDAAVECTRRGCGHRRDSHHPETGACQSRVEAPGWPRPCRCIEFTDEPDPAVTYPSVHGHRLRTDALTHASIEESMAGEPTLLTRESIYKRERADLPVGFRRGSTLTRWRRKRLKARRERREDTAD